MVRDAEAQAAADKAKREEAEVRNNASSLIYSTEKSLKEVGEKLDAGARGEVESGALRAQARQRKRHGRRDQARDRDAAAGQLQDGRAAVQEPRRREGDGAQGGRSRRRGAQARNGAAAERAAPTTSSTPSSRKRK